MLDFERLQPLYISHINNKNILNFYEPTLYDDISNTHYYSKTAIDILISMMRFILNHYERDDREGILDFCRSNVSTYSAIGVIKDTSFFELEGNTLIGIVYSPDNIRYIRTILL